MKRFKEEDLSKPFKLYGANSTRDFLNADDVCEIIIKLVLKNHEGIVNIASGNSIKIIDFAQKIAPQKINFDFDADENINHLNADISLLNTILKNNE
jgi:nucleoside-diphosphate-sugar epimerase